MDFLHGAGERINQSIAHVNVQVVPASVDDCAENEQEDDEFHCRSSARYLKTHKVDEVEEVDNSAYLNEQHYPVRIVD